MSDDAARPPGAEDPAQAPEPTHGTRRRRARRRAVGGSRPTTADPLIPARSADDSDQGWGERPPPADGEDDDRFLREVPPHW